MGGGGITDAQGRDFPAPGESGRHRAGKLLGAVAVVWSLTYLVWRAGWSWGGADAGVAWWLAVPALTIEFLGLAGTALLIWALSGRSEPHPQRPPAESGAEFRTEIDHDVVVVVGGRPAYDVRATLVALAGQSDEVHVFVVDRRYDPLIEETAREFGAQYSVAVGDEADLDAAAGAGDAEFVFVLAAGDIPLPDAIGRLASWVTSPSVAAVQGELVAISTDASQADRLGRGEFAFQHSVLNPALGARGVGFLAGTGSLIRRSALRSITIPAGPRHAVLWGLTAQFTSQGMQVLASSGAPIVASRPVSADGSLADRQRRSDAAWRLLHGPNGTLRGHGVPLRVRLSSAAWAMRPLDGLRRLVVIAVVIAALLAGRPPFVISAVAIVGLWVPAFILGSISVVLLSSGTLRIGDRLRASVRHRGLAVALVIGINAVLVVRGISDRFTHAMRPLDASTQIVLVTIALWTLAACLDSLRLLVSRRFDRRARRIETVTPGVWAETVVSVLDVTMLGAGVITNRRPSPGERHTLRLDLHTDSGVSTLETPTVVRNVREDVGGLWRVGLEFEQTDPFVLNALAEICVVDPVRGMVTGPRVDAAAYDLIDVETVSDSFGSRRVALRGATLLALGGVVSSVAPAGAIGLDELPLQRLLVVVVAGLLAAAMLLTAVPTRRAKGL